MEKRIDGWGRLGRRGRWKKGSLLGLLDWIRKPNMGREREMKASKSEWQIWIDKAQNKLIWGSGLKHKRTNKKLDLGRTCSLPLKEIAPLWPFKAESFGKFSRPHYYWNLGKDTAVFLTGRGRGTFSTLLWGQQAQWGETDIEEEKADIKLGAGWLQLTDVCEHLMSLLGIR